MELKTLLLILPYAFALNCNDADGTSIISFNEENCIKPGAIYNSKLSNEGRILRGKTLNGLVKFDFQHVGWLREKRCLLLSKYITKTIAK